jgi:uncharacterized 2Fe-2S/4Fe-4S cluster protein (DUF4445 family)
MPTCINHPDRETPYQCMKHQIYLCEACLKCRDPKIYCKFRSSCPIWFMERQHAKQSRADALPDTQPVYSVTFHPGERNVTVSVGTTLLEAARTADVYVNASCNGKGACGKCKVILESGPVETEVTSLLSEIEKNKGYALACQTRVSGHMTVRIPEEAIERKLRIAGMGQAATERLRGLVPQIDPLLNEIELSLDPPTLDDPVSDLDRLNRGLKKAGVDVDRLNVGLKVMRQLAETMRREQWKITVSLLQRKCAHEILEVASGHQQSRSLGLAIDVGTTSIVVYLVDMADGAVLAAASGHNRQAACGDDVINRIICAEKEGVKKLSAMALATVNDLIGEALASVVQSGRSIRNVVLSGNTTMMHLLLRIEPRFIRREPYVPSISEFPVLKAGEIGLKTNPLAAVFVVPAPAGYVGGDIVAGVLYAGFHQQEALTLFIDVGTNGEIVLGNREWLMTAACSAGPAFEGGGIHCGMRAEEGAIEKVTIDRLTWEPQFQTVGGLPPRGICGSGMIDLISELLEAGIVDRAGRFQTERRHARLIEVKGEAAYALAAADHTPMQEDIVFTESDLKNLLYSKAAVYAGFSTLLQQAGLDFTSVERLIIAGGFGQYLDIEKSVRIGLLPDIDRSRFTYLGNSSIAGAYMTLLSEASRRSASAICSNMTYIDFSSNSHYMDAFTSALFLPHTDLNQFPSILAA